MINMHSNNQRRRLKLAKLSLVFILMTLAGCSSLDQQQVMVLDYRDFGPQVVAHTLIGKEWPQWWPHGDSRPTVYDIQVIVYKNVSLEKIQKRYPVSEEKNKDFRYLPYDDAIQFLNTQIDKNILPVVTERLKATRARIESAMR